MMRRRICCNASSTSSSIADVLGGPLFDTIPSRLRTGYIWHAIRCCRVNWSSFLLNAITMKPITTLTSPWRKSFNRAWGDKISYFSPVISLSASTSTVSTDIDAVAQSLLEQEFGSFNEAMWMQSKSILQQVAFSQLPSHKALPAQPPPPQSRTILLALRLWERCLEECFHAYSIDISGEAPTVITAPVEHAFEEQSRHDPSSMQQHSWSWFGNPYFYNSLLRQWSKAISYQQNATTTSSAHVGLWTANQLQAKLHRWWSLSSLLQLREQHFSELEFLFRMDSTTIFSVLRGVLAEQQQENPAMAPYLVDAWLQYYEEQSGRGMNSGIQQQDKQHNALLPHPDAYSYCLVFEAWIKTKSRTIANRSRIADNDATAAIIQKRLDSLMERMRYYNIKPTNAIYDILLRFWEDQQRADQIDFLLQEQTRNLDTPPDTTNLARGVSVHAQHGNLVRANQLLQRMLVEQEDHSQNLTDPTNNLVSNSKKKKTFIKLKQNEHNQRAIEKAVQSILRAYRNVVNKSNTSSSSSFTKRQALLQATQLADHIQQNQILDASSLVRMHETVLDLHIRAGKGEKEIQTLLTRQQQQQHLASSSRSDNRIDSHSNDQQNEAPSRVTVAVLLNSHDRHNRAEKATQELKRLQREENSLLQRLDRSIFVSVLNAWAESGRKDAVEQAWAVLKLMDQQKIDVVVFGALMKCVANSNRSSAGAEAEQVLQEMQRRNVRPNAIVYNQAIAACYCAHDLSRAERLLMAMEESPHLPSPDLRTYTESLLYFSKHGTIPAAERCEAILHHLYHLSSSQTNNIHSPSLKPDAYTYSIAISAWARVLQVGDRVTDGCHVSDRMWALYRHMVDETGAECDAVTYHQLISHLSKSHQQLQNLERAEQLLKSMEQQQNAQPDALDYFAIMIGWLRAKCVDRAARILIRRVEAYIHQKRPVGDRLSLAIRLVVTSMAKAGEVLQATALLFKMQELYLAGKLPEGPEPLAYHAVLDAWRASSHTQKDKHIAKLESTLLDFKG